MIYSTNKWYANTEPSNVTKYKHTPYSPVYSNFTSVTYHQK
uniref:Uncharacterized protein n=1 Tax=Rhizophora mucronata TaxID=61149 RepID=A0A2P2J1U8_RHIMU